MQEFINKVTQSLGIEADVAQNAVGTLMGLISDNAGAEAANDLMGKIPGGSELMTKFSETAAAGSSSAGGGLTGGLMGAAGSVLGGSAGGAMQAMGALQNAGLGMTDAGKFVSMFAEYAQENAGTEMVSGLLGKVPGLDKFF